MHQTEKAIVLRIADFEEQETLIKMDPEVFYVTDHYSGHPMCSPDSQRSRRHKSSTYSKRRDA